jgi:hypothetical protein
MNMRKIVKDTGETLRLSELQIGDVVDVYEDDGEHVGKYQIASSPTEDENGIWSAMSDPIK